MKTLRTCILLLLLGIAPAAAQVTGYVDLHSHLMAEHSFGGGWFWGTVEGPMDWAVRRCDGNFPTASHAATVFPIVSEFIGDDTGWHLGIRRGYDRRQCKYFLGMKIPGTCPKPHFEDWPMWDAIAHQQMWHGWLRQAHQGGLRVMVVSLAESSFLCANTAYATRRYDCNEMASVQRQATFAHDFASRNSSWVGIATSPAQARALIAQGKLALVLAVEVTKLFPSGDYIAQLDQLRAMGIRSVQIVHHADNRFGGAAQIPALRKAANTTEFLWGLEMTGINNITCRSGSGIYGTCDGGTFLNIQGLTADGAALVNAMMDRGMLVDVAHLSRKGFVDTYNIAHQRGDYPLLYSHAHMWETITGVEKNEKFLRDDEIFMISSTGGMVGLRTGPEATNPYAGASPVANTCAGSARSFAQSLMYAVDRGLTVGFGADLNGFTEQLSPRFNIGCLSDVSQIIASGGPNDLHKKGLAHVGLLPALMTDLQRVGLSTPYLDHLNNSAENFLRMWERSVSFGTVPPVSNLAMLAAVSASSTYCSGGADHCYSAGRVNDGSRNTTLGGLHSWTNDWGAPMPQWVELTWSSPVAVSRVDVYTTSGYMIRDYDVEYWNGSSWQDLVPPVTNNNSLSRSHLAPAPVSTTRLRVLGRSGPSHQAGYVRINEIEVY